MRHRQWSALPSAVATLAGSHWSNPRPLVFFSFTAFLICAFHRISNSFHPGWMTGPLAIYFVKLLLFTLAFLVHGALVLFVDSPRFLRQAFLQSVMKCITLSLFCLFSILLMVFFSTMISVTLLCN